MLSADTTNPQSNLAKAASNAQHLMDRPNYPANKYIRVPSGNIVGRNVVPIRVSSIGCLYVCSRNFNGTFMGYGTKQHKRVPCGVDMGFNMVSMMVSLTEYLVIVTC